MGFGTWSLEFSFAALLFLTFTVSAQNYIPKPNEFPPLDRATYISGELVVVDPINRRGGIRIDCGIRDERRASDGPLHYFAMLPCGEIWLHGAPATLPDGRMMRASRSRSKTPRTA